MELKMCKHSFRFVKLHTSYYMYSGTQRMIELVVFTIGHSLTRTIVNNPKSTMLSVPKYMLLHLWNFTNCWYVLSSSPMKDMTVYLHIISFEDLNIFIKCFSEESNPRPVRYETNAVLTTLCRQGLKFSPVHMANSLALASDHRKTLSTQRFCHFKWNPSWWL